MYRRSIRHEVLMCIVPSHPRVYDREKGDTSSIPQASVSYWNVLPTLLNIRWLISQFGIRTIRTTEHWSMG